MTRGRGWSRGLLGNENPEPQAKGTDVGWSRGTTRFPSVLRVNSDSGHVRAQKGPGDRLGAAGTPPEPLRGAAPSFPPLRRSARSARRAPPALLRMPAAESATGWSRVTWPRPRPHRKGGWDAVAPVEMRPCDPPPPSPHAVTLDEAARAGAEPAEDRCARRRAPPPVGRRGALPARGDWGVRGPGHL